MPFVFEGRQRLRFSSVASGLSAGGPGPPCARRRAVAGRRAVVPCAESPRPFRAAVGPPRRRRMVRDPERPCRDTSVRGGGGGGGGGRPGPGPRRAAALQQMVSGGGLRHYTIAPVRAMAAGESAAMRAVGASAASLGLSRPVALRALVFDHRQKQSRTGPYRRWVTAPVSGAAHLRPRLYSMSMARARAVGVGRPGAEAGTGAGRAPFRPPPTRRAAQAARRHSLSGGGCLLLGFASRALALRVTGKDEAHEVDAEC